MPHRTHDLSPHSPDPLRRTLLRGAALGAAAAGLGASASAFAQGAYPTKPISLLVPFPPGSATDAIARALSAVVSQKLGQQVLVENRPGAAGTLASGIVAQSKTPDGYQIAIAPATLFKVPHMQKVPYEPLKDLTYIMGFSGYTFALVVPESSPWKTYDEFIAYGKANPGKITIGAVGTSMEMEVAMLQVKAGVKAQAIPYKANTNMQSDIAVGDLHLGISSYTANKSLIDTGRIVLLGVGSKERDPKLPGTPAIGEVVPGHELTPFWFGVIAPPKTPAPIVQKLSDAVIASMREPDTAAAFEKVGMKVDARNSADYRAFLEKESARFREAANLIGLKPQ